MIQTEFEVKNNFGNVVLRTEDRKAAEEAVAAKPEELKVEEKKYYQEIRGEEQKTFMEAQA